MKNNPIVGPDGNPVRTQSEAKKPGDLSIEIQALVETRVNTALDTARENLRQEIANAKQRLVDDIAGARRTSITRYVILAVVNAGAAILLWVYGPREVREWTRVFVANNMAKPTLEAAAKDVITNRMDAFVSEKLLPISKGIQSLETQIHNSEQGITHLKEEQRLVTLMNRAETFDREAFRELQAVAAGTNEISLLAQAMVAKVTRILMLDRSSITYLTSSEQVGEYRYGGPYTSDEVASHLTQASGTLVEAVVNSLGNDQKIFVPKLVDLAHSNKDLWLVNRIAKKLNEIAGVDFYPWDLQPLDRWWTQNSVNYTNWPFEEYERGTEAFRACRYAEALPILESILLVDPRADMSRSLAVACAVEIGDLPKAQHLNSNYALKNGRWETWASGKMLLATNAIEVATKHFVSLTTNYPSFPSKAWIGEGNHILRQVDWALYSKLLRATTNTISGNTNVTR